MDADAIGQLSRILQLSITPVALISGVGLLLLSMTNRLGRVIDRARVLGREAASADPASSFAGADGQSELRILFRRARLLQLGIAMISLAIFMAVLMVAALFAMYLLSANLDYAVLPLFGACLLCLATSIGFFLGDVFLSIRWLRLSLGRYV